MSIRAGIVRVALMTAPITLFQMAPQCGCSTSCDGAEHTFLCRGQGSSMSLAVLIAMSAHNVGEFESGPHNSPTT
jgi:hypothetical protein